MVSPSVTISSGVAFRDLRSPRVRRCRGLRRCAGPFLRPFPEEMELGHGSSPRAWREASEHLGRGGLRRAREVRRGALCSRPLLRRAGIPVFPGANSVSGARREVEGVPQKSWPDLGLPATRGMFLASKRECRLLVFEDCFYLGARILPRYEITGLFSLLFRYLNVTS